ncbi:biotin transporter BioY [Pelagibacterales bacterium SAG-MED19]|nr:biotin transporter BioY [Pelagibacterales bacterium SAG-MED19]
MELIKQNTQSKIIKSLLIIFFGSIILAISAKIKIPFYPVPMTMQTFIVLFFGISFGYKIALATVSLYLLEGIIGFPVFSNSPERGVGLAYFTGPTMGYLIGFLSACFLASYIRIDNNHFVIFVKLVLSVLTIYIFGVLWLGVVIGWDKPVFELGVMPFLLAEIFKVTLLTLLSKKIFKIRKLI